MRKYFSVSYDNTKIGCKRAKRFAERFFFESLRLIHGIAELFRRNLYRRRHQLMTAIFGFILSGDDAYYIVFIFGSGKRAKHVFCKFGCSEEKYSHSSSPPSSSSLVIILSALSG